MCAVLPFVVVRHAESSTGGGSMLQMVLPFVVVAAHSLRAIRVVLACDVDNVTVCSGDMFAESGSCGATMCCVFMQ